MAASMKNTKFDKKIWKKLNKLKQTLYKRENVTCSDKPTSILCVSNGGLDNGITHEEIAALFGDLGKKVDVMLLPQKSYCFVCFSSSEESERAYTQLNGHKLEATCDRKTEVILYLSYVSQVSESVCPSTERPPGLILIEDFVSQEYADDIMKSINWSDANETGTKQDLKHRRVKHYGYEFLYTINNVDPDQPLQNGIPSVYKPLLDNVLATGHVKHCPDQLTINQYQPGQGIPAHVDTPSAFEDGLVSLSLGSQVLMEFRHPDGRHLSVLLPSRSLLIMTGESRYIWSHGITPRKSDIVPVPGGGLSLSQRGVRTSFTFRKITGVKHGQDTRDQQQQLPNTDEAAAMLEKSHVHQVYEEIADHFSGTRHTPWPRIVDFLHSLPPGALLADIGCGNGKYLGINKHIYELGSDRSFNLSQICNERQIQVYIGDILSIPLRPAVFDACICIAVIHHLSTKERRIRAITELMKILTPGGRALIYVWAIEQELNKVKSKYLKLEKKTETDKSSSHVCADRKCDGEDVSHNETDDCGNLETKTKEMCTTHDNKVKPEFITVDQTVDKSCNIDKEVICDDTNLKTEKKVEEYSNISNSASRGDTQNNQTLEVHVNRTAFKQQDVLVPWQLRNKDKENKKKEANTFHRFYHVFQKGEIEELCRSVSCCKVILSYYDQGNWAVILQKK